MRHQVRGNRELRLHMLHDVMRLGEDKKSRLILRGDRVQAAGQQHAGRKDTYSGVHQSCLTARERLTVATTPYWSGPDAQFNIELLHNSLNLCVCTELSSIGSEKQRLLGTRAIAGLRKSLLNWCWDSDPS